MFSCTKVKFQVLNFNMHISNALVDKFSQTLLFCSLMILTLKKNWPKSFMSASTSSGNYDSRSNLTGQTTGKEPDVDKQLLAKGSLWFVPSFLRKTDSKTDTDRTIAKKRRLCIFNIDIRSLERFADVNDITKMKYYSVAAYNNLYYGKPSYPLA